MARFEHHAAGLQWPVNTNDLSSATAAALVRMVIMIQSNVPSGMCLPSDFQVAIG
jgi:hypothetical protein